jgi:DeoR/GlpR family transcriptional regulator of sugar metabolism
MQLQERNGVLAAERKNLILARLQSQGAVNTQDLATELDLSEDTLRRDLRDLAAEGLCQRVYGGALPASPATADLRTRESIEPLGKDRVAGTAAGMVVPGSTIILDGGTTALALVRALPVDFACTVITHSPTIATALLDRPAIDVFLLGGRIFRHSGVACGAVTAEAARTITADAFFMGVTGVHASAGLTTGDAEEAAMKRTLSERAVETYVLASGEKIGTASAYKVLGLSDVTGVVSDPEADPSALARLAEAGVRLIGVA